MKRILFLVGITATLFVGCKKEKDEPKSKPPVQTSLETDCSFFSVLESMTPAERVNWLKDKETDICESNDYLECIGESHQLDSLHISIVESQMATAKIKTFTLREILNEQECSYSKYIAFHVDSTGDISIDTNSDFDTNYSCYSRPLFYGLQKKHNLTTATEFKFFEVDFGGSIGKTVVFKIENITNAYFDYSRWPTLIPAKNPL
ncbi:hypothetical protein [Flavobacterium suzhouense]|uniref:Lipoprotein n=1 Tax=Flavobacterium suzhouense TaxID=1529638 RepID=A0ABW5NX11_9FLAO